MPFTYLARVKRLLVALLATALFACDDPESSGGQARPDDARPAADAVVDASPRADAGPADRGAAPDRGAPDAGPTPLPCADDEACGERAYCGEEGACRPAADAPFVLPPTDGVTRAAAQPFDIAPDYLERWIDRAGEACVGNRPGRFDGRVDRPDPEDPCADGFEDADGDGRLDTAWLGGDGGERPALGVDNENPPEGRVLLLARDDLLYLLVTLDVHALDAARSRDLRRRLQLRLGVPAERIAVHATGNRSGPDAVGLWGPGPAVAGLDALEQRGRLGLLGEGAVGGVDEVWWTEVLRRSAAAARQAGPALRPIEVREARVELPTDPPLPVDGAVRVPDSDGDGRANDREDLTAWRQRTPLLVRDDTLPGTRALVLRALALDDTTQRATVAVLVGTSAAPAASPRNAPTLNADVAGVTRRVIEAARPGAVALWLTGASADTVLLGRDAFVPEVDADGRPVDADGRPAEHLDAAAPAARPVDALGRFLAGHALNALRDAPAAPAAMMLTSRYAWVPLTSPRVAVAAWLGVMARLGDWLTGRRATNAWSSGTTTPACGGLGCVRYRLDRLTLGPVTLLTTPGGLDDAYVRGRPGGSLELADQRTLRDLDLDGVPDIDDPELRVMARGRDGALPVVLNGPANPVVLAGVTGLGAPGLWIVGGTNGGVGSLRPAPEVMRVFEGQLEPLLEMVRSPGTASLDLCALGYPCAGALTLGALVDRLVAALPAEVADVRATQELWLSEPFAEPEGPLTGAWWIEDAEGVARVAGEGGVMLGPGNTVFFEGVDLDAVAVGPGDRLVIDRADAEGAPDARPVGGVLPVVLRQHPLAADAWWSAAPSGGDYVYNTACELLFDGACPHRRPTLGDDPNQSLPRTP